MSFASQGNIRQSDVFTSETINETINEQDFVSNFVSNIKSTNGQ